MIEESAIFLCVFCMVELAVERNFLQASLFHPEPFGRFGGRSSLSCNCNAETALGCSCSCNAEAAAASLHLDSTTSSQLPVSYIVFWSEPPIVISPVYTTPLCSLRSRCTNGFLAFFAKTVVWETAAPGARDGGSKIRLAFRLCRIAAADPSKNTAATTHHSSVVCFISSGKSAHVMRLNGSLSLAEP